MDKKEAITYFKKTKLYSLVNEKVSDISFNGQLLFVEEINGFRRLAPFSYDYNEAFDTIKHIADLCGKNFNYAHPLLDLSFENIRINAVHPSLARVGYFETINFSIRISSHKNRIQEDSLNFAPKSVLVLLNKIIAHNQSMMIGGLTGSGKSELQRYLIAQISLNKRIIVLQDSAEIVSYDSKQNMSSWLYNIDDLQQLEALFKAGLRSNPDWLMLSEVRGNEAKSLFKAITSGLPIITTIHAKEAKDIKTRLLALLDLKSKDDYLRAQKELANYVNYYILVQKRFHEDKMHREIGAIALLYQMENVVYESIIYQKNIEETIYAPLPLLLAKQIHIGSDWYDQE